MPEAWLRGPVPGVPDALMPGAHALLDAREELVRAAEPLTPSQLWATPGGVASVGFHLRHVVGSLDRLLTYARGRALSSEQLQALAGEAEPGTPPEAAGSLLEGVERAIDAALAVYRETDPATLHDRREVGRAKLPSTVLGLLFHAAEHTRRHAGQVIATARIVRNTDAAARVDEAGLTGLRVRSTAGSARIAGRGDRDALARMRRSLWPDSEAAEVDALLARPPREIVLLVAEADGVAAGFAEVGTRTYAEGCRTSPVAYLEGIWVEPAHRRRGVATLLVQAAEAWAYALGLTELASDTQPENEASLRFHRANGFEEVETTVCLRRRVSAPPAEPT